VHNHEQEFSAAEWFEMEQDPEAAAEDDNADGQQNDYEEQEIYDDDVEMSGQNFEFIPLKDIEALSLEDGQDNMDINDENRACSMCFFSN
jgi:hypothetical protein